MFKKVIMVGLLCLPLTFAQELADLLPVETFLALGSQDLAAHKVKLEPFIAEFQRLELGAALGQLLATEDNESTDAGSEDFSLPVELQGLEITDVIGQEAWVAVSASRFNPLPALTLVARVSDEASPGFDSLLEDAASQAEIQELQEGDIGFYQQQLTVEGVPDQVIAFAKQGDLLILSSNPDVMRGVLRQLQGSNDPSFSDSQGYKSTLAELGVANFTGYLDYAQLPEALSTYVQGLGFDKLVKRLTEALDTAGVSAGVVRFTDDGLSSESYQAVNFEGKDKKLLNLLTNNEPVDSSSLSFFSQDALSFSAQRLDLGAWWAYLNDISKSTPELGGSLDELLELFVGVNLQDSLFSWTGDQYASITTAPSEIVQPGVAASNLLGEQVFILEVTDEQKAQEGLILLMQSAGGGIASFANPSGQALSADVTSKMINDIEVMSFGITEGISLSYAFVDGFVLIATSEGAMMTALSGEGNVLSESLLNSIQEGVSGFSITDNRRSLESSAEQIISQLQLTAGFGGSSTLDFEAVDALSTKLQEYFAFVAERFGHSVNLTDRSKDGVYSSGTTEVTW